MERNPARKGQSEIMEYIVMVVLIVAAIIAIILFLSWWSIMQIEMQGSKNQNDKIVSLGQMIMGDYMLINEQAMLDDAKLTSLVSMSSEGCERLQALLGANWYAKIKSLDMEGDIPCTWGNYPDCNSWTICEYKEPHIAQVFPVNVYRKLSDKAALAVLEVGVYT